MANLQLELTGQEVADAVAAGLRLKHPEYEIDQITLRARGGVFSVVAAVRTKQWEDSTDGT